ncbi:MarC family protein [Kaistia algarum]|uniref:MarC family protein n=1 Tax=Kaistia algarum TaxID=2083279 RepID=UPI000CE87497|nr:MarC family protein [Kaistia algarum]MCX5514696.1 MarC family protein [Kaistia algarum]PPE78878.1 MarC family protein [Kaistia algarum]
MSNTYPVLMFLALLALFSPLAALSAYMPVVGRYSARDQMRLVVGLFINVAIFALGSVWIGEPLLNLLGISTAALAMTGGIALLYAGIPMMQGTDEIAPEQNAARSGDGEGAGETENWRKILFTPLTFPLTVGGTSFGIIVAFSSNSRSLADHVAFSVAGLGYAALAAGTLYAAGHLHRRVSPQARMILSRIAGILLTAIAVSLLADGGTRLVVATLASLGRG